MLGGAKQESSSLCAHGPKKAYLRLRVLCVIFAQSLDVRVFAWACLNHSLMVRQHLRTYLSWCWFPISPLLFYFFSWVDCGFPGREIKIKKYYIKHRAQSSHRVVTQCRFLYEMEKKKGQKGEWGKEERKVDSDLIFSLVSNSFTPAVLAWFADSENLLDHKCLLLAKVGKGISRF